MKKGYQFGICGEHGIHKCKNGYQHCRICGREFRTEEELESGAGWVLVDGAMVKEG